jgi:hypothetical protein
VNIAGLDQQKADAVAGELGGGVAVGVAVDVTDEIQVDSWVARTSPPSQDDMRLERKLQIVAAPR